MTGELRPLGFVLATLVSVILAPASAAAQHAPVRSPPQLASPAFPLRDSRLAPVALAAELGRGRSHLPPGRVEPDCRRHPVRDGITGALAGAVAGGLLFYLTIGVFADSKQHDELYYRYRREYLVGGAVLGVISAELFPFRDPGCPG